MLSVGSEAFVDTIQGTRKVTIIERRDDEVLVEFTSNLLQTWVGEEDIREQE